MSNILSILDDAMTVREMIEKLKEMPLDARVVFESNYGDRHRTRQLHLAQSIAEFDCEKDCIYETAYSESGLAIAYDPEPDIEIDDPWFDKQPYKVVVIN